MSELLKQNNEYKKWLLALKLRVKQTQLKAAVKVNSTLIEFYWSLGEDIVNRQAETTWGSGFLKQLSHDLMAEFPDIKGFSRRNLEQIRRWYVFWSKDNAIAKQAASQLVLIPWRHNLVIVSKSITRSYLVPTLLRGNAEFYSESRMGYHAGAWEPGQLV